MADKKISELTNITGANLADADEFVVVDTSANETKAITYAELKSGLDTSTGFVRVTGDTMTGNLSFGDNNKAIFGAGSDLQIYHDGSNNWVDAVSGAMFVRGSRVDLRGANNEMLLVGNQNGNVTLYYDNSPKLATTSTGVDVTGTVTADGLTVDGNPIVRGTIPYIYLYETDTTNLNTGLRGADGQFQIRTVDDVLSTTVKRFSLDHATGDIAFYEDTGTTPKLFWDASAEALGIGTSSPAYTLDIAGGPHVYYDAGNSLGIFSASAGKDVSILARASQNLRLSAGGTERLRIDASGNVGIGTSSPAAKLDLQGGRTFLQSSSGDQYVLRLTNPANVSGVYLGNPADNSFAVYTAAGTERLRIDASGNLLVGKTSNTYGVVGAAFGATGSSNFTRSANPPVGMNRLSTDGDILVFAKDSTTVGSIGTDNAGDVYIGNDDTGLLFAGGADAIYPWNPATLASRDSAIDIGGASIRFKNLYLSGGVYLGGTGAANLLDDYEEGAWTPTLPNGGTLTVAAATYTKVGRKVTATVHVSFVNPSADANQFRIGGLPFTNAAITNYYVGGSFGYMGQNDLSTLLPITGSGLNYIYFHENSGTVTAPSNNTMRAKGLTGESQDAMLFSITYFTA